MRLIQAGRGERRDLVCTYYLGAYADAGLRKAAPNAIICTDTRSFDDVQRGVYRAVGSGCVLPMNETVAWALQEARALAVGRVVILGFSAGCAAVRSLLQRGMGRQPDAVVTVDGTHASNPPAPGQIEVWQQLAREARSGQRPWVATHTSIQPPDFMSTRRVLELATGLELPPGHMSRAGDGELHVWSYPGRDAAAHSAQAQVVAAEALGEAMAALARIATKDEPADPVAPTLRTGAETLAQATLRHALADLAAGVHETSRNDGPRVREMLRRVGCVPPANWCASAVSAWVGEAAAELCVPAPVRSAGARALGAQLRAQGRWVDARDVKPEHLQPGTVLVWARGNLSDPTEWRGHVGLLEWYEPNGERMHTVEGNSGPKGDCVAQMVRYLRDPQLLGVGQLDGPGAAAAAWALEELHAAMAWGAEALCAADPLA